MLFQPFAIRGLTLKNRLVVPPMVHYRAEAGNTCGTFHVVHLGRYALGGFGLVFVEATGGGGCRPHQRARSRHLERRPGRKLQAADRLHEAPGHRDRHSACPRRPQSVIANRDAGHGPADRGESEGRRQELAAGRADGRARRKGLADAAPAHHRRVQGDGRHLGACGAKRGQGRLRHHRDPHRARLSAGLVPVAGLQHAQRRIWRRPSRAHAAAARDRRGGAQGDARRHAAVRARLLGRRHASKAGTWTTPSSLRAS